MRRTWVCSSLIAFAVMAAPAVTLAQTSAGRARTDGPIDTFNSLYQRGICVFATIPRPNSSGANELGVLVAAREPSRRFAWVMTDVSESQLPYDARQYAGFLQTILQNYPLAGPEGSFEHPCKATASEKVIVMTVIQRGGKKGGHIVLAGMPPQVRWEELVTKDTKVARRRALAIVEDILGEPVRPANMETSLGYGPQVSTRWSQLFEGRGP